MLSSLSVISTLGFAGLYPLTYSPSAVSTEAATLQKSFSQVVQSVELSEALFGIKRQVLDELDAVGLECALSDWDGNGAHPVNLASLLRAQSFVRALPDDVAMPTVSPEPDGGISLEWIKNRHRRLAVSLSDQTRIPIAWIDGSRSGHATETFDSGKLPLSVVDQLRALVGQ